MMGTLNEHIPSHYVPDVVASYKTRIKLKGGPFEVTVLAATAQKKLELFTKGKLLSRHDLPFGDCCKLLHLPFISSTSCRNYVIALSQAKCVVVVDLELDKIVKNWTSIEDIELNDELCIGYSQLVLIYRGSMKSTVTPEFGWEPQSDYLDGQIEEEPTAVHSVVTALENQLKSACNELYSKQNQLSVRKTLLNRSLDALCRTITLQPCKSRAPSFTIPVRGNSHSKNTKDDPEDELPLRTSEIWQVVDGSSSSWIIGTVFQITSDCLTNIRCALVTNDAPYHINYFLEKHEEKTCRVQPFSGSLNQGDRLFVTAVTNVPDFKLEEIEVAQFFLTCHASHRPEKLFQYNLGSCVLSFKDVADESLSFNHVTNKQPIPNEQMYSLISLLSYEEKYVIESSAKENLPRGVLNDVAKKLKLLYNPTLRCYYNFSFYGHVVMLVLEENDTQIEISVRTLTSRYMQMFVRHLKNNLHGEVALTFFPPHSDPDTTPHELLTSSFELLSSGKEEEDDEPMEVAEQPNESQIEKIRRAFLRKQKLMISSNRNSHIIIPNDAYCKWQDNYFAC